MRNTPAQPHQAPVNRALLRRIREQVRSAQFVKYLRKLLVELCEIDTTAKSEPTLMRAAEDSCFKVLERELDSFAFGQARRERRPINPAIEKHPAFSLLHFTKTPGRLKGLSAEATYAGRSNLVYILEGTQARAAGQSIVLNAHLDVVPPYFPPRVQGNTVLGRGACDDKGPVVSIVGALKLLAHTLNPLGLALNRNVVGMFVVEEETGGNGSLSLAVDRELRRAYDSVLVCECTDLKIHPANRGAVWYRAELRAPKGVPALELFAFVNEEMEKEGAAIRAESRHDLFPQRPVQTCHGMIGAFGEHPSRICGEVSFIVYTPRSPTQPVARLLEDCLQSGLASYVGLYGDKSKVVDPATGQPMIRRHYDLHRTRRGFRVDVHGAAGHMGSIRERDGAITKMAHLVRALVLSKARLEALADGHVHLSLAAGPTSKKAGTTMRPSRRDIEVLIFEGGQGFVPTHSMQEIMNRLRQAAARGAENYLHRIGNTKPGKEVVSIAYEKLHNDAFDGDPDSASVRNAIAAARACRIWRDEPVLGWTVSCDARLFATENPGMQVLSFGPGQLIHAHSDREQITLPELQSAAEFLAVFLLLQTGTISLK
jgi:acetylornithine deacetylase/succinyl-diaminopimelate desuccinylase-like protein